jgi:hypothetical protein
MMDTREKVEDRISKLPKWVQQYIQKLHRDTTILRHHLSQIELETPTAITWDAFSSDASVGIPDRATITVETPKGIIQLNYRDDRIYVSGHDTLVIEPRASNAAYIGLKAK